MQEEVETVDAHCKHDDCIYRVLIDGGRTPVCYYAVIEGKSRGCPISQCDKYQAGERKGPKMKRDYTIYWEFDLYDEDADFIW